MCFNCATCTCDGEEILVPYRDGETRKIFSIFFSKQVSNYGTFTTILFNNCDYASINFISWLPGACKCLSNSRFPDLLVDMVSSNVAWKAKLVLRDNTDAHVHEQLINRFNFCARSKPSHTVSHTHPKYCLHTVRQGFLLDFFLEGSAYMTFDL